MTREYNPDTHEQELFATQEAFRAVMDAMARPGMVRKVPPLHRPRLSNPWLETIACMLIDSACTFCVAAADEEAFRTALATRTYAKAQPPDAARFAVIAADADPDQATEVLLGLSGGNDISPEKGATALIECEALGIGQAFCATGPGIAKRHVFLVSSAWWHDAREARKDEFPRGIDIILVDGAGRVMAVPRTTRLEKTFPTDRPTMPLSKTALSDSSPHCSKTEGGN
ncbi:MAG: phosphonate C-P lyase system protein PhnH [Coriobacteriaceae bacterium]|jgi:alpha-D-ribose 1-methylphosphonate 5-triphosphate synthase subunit PhnH|nr:phosphonate C-P lyase system protein PhnH [Coriobacteriaceae bacterium]